MDPMARHRRSCRRTCAISIAIASVLSTACARDQNPYSAMWRSMFDPTETVAEMVQRRSRNPHATSHHRDELMTATCLTGPSGEREEWIALEHAGSGGVLYRNLVRKDLRSDAPCAAFLEAPEMLRFHQRKQARAPHLEVLDDESHEYVERPRANMQHALSIGAAAEDAMGEDSIRGGEIKIGSDAAAALELDAANDIDWIALPSVVDELDVMAMAAVFEDLSEAAMEIMRRTAADTQVDLEMDAVDTDALLQDAVREEHDAIARIVDGKRWPATALTVDAWDTMRLELTQEEREILAARWTRIGMLLLQQTNRPALTFRCLRRALAWDSQHLDAFMLLAELLLQTGRDQESCRSIDKMLEHADIAQRQSMDMRAFLLDKYAHCSPLLRLAQLWEQSMVLRCVVAISVVVSFAHGLFVVLTCCNRSVPFGWLVQDPNATAPANDRERERPARGRKAKHQ